jgi:enoyl-CoA hydratase
LLVERDAGVAVMTLNRPEKKNALSRDLRRAVTRAFREAASDESVRAIVLTGAGSAFCAGVDLGELSGQSGRAPDAEELEPRELDMVAAIRECPVPVIAAVNGVAITGGFELALACDVIYAASDARFADTHARLGILPTWGIALRLPRLIGIARAKELSFSGRFLDSVTAERWGLVNRVVEAGELMAEARTLAEEIASADPAAVRGMKKMYDESNDRNFAAGLDHAFGLAVEHFRGLQPGTVASRRSAVQERNRAQTSA